jgi:hypothetical protein
MMVSGSPRGGQQPDVDDRGYGSFDEEEYDDWDEYDGEEERFVPRQFRERRGDFNSEFSDDDDEHPVPDMSADLVYHGRSDDEDIGDVTGDFESFSLDDFTRDAAGGGVDHTVQVRRTHVRNVRTYGVYGDDSDDDGEAPLVRSFSPFSMIYFSDPFPMTLLADVPRTAPAAVDPDPTLVAEVAKEGDETCCVCSFNVPDCEFVDCRHCATGFICRICADILVRSAPPANACPLCRTVVTDYKVIAPVASSVPDAWDD